MSVTYRGYHDEIERLEELQADAKARSDSTIAELRSNIVML